MFTHLHLHTEYSLLDGLSRIPQLVERVEQLGQRAVGITDHGVMYGVLDLYKEARNHGIKPILGMEGYMAPGSRSSREPKDKTPYHITLLAQNLTGYRNLMALSSRAHLEGYYYKPRLDRELLEEHREGLIVLSGCPSSEIHRALQDGRWDDARASINWFRERFPQFYLEIQEHGDAQFSRINPMLVQLSRETGLPLVCTNDSHYTSPDDASPHDILLCIGTNATVHDTKRMRMEGGSYYVKSEDEMRALFPELPEAIDNSWHIAEQCELELEFGRLHLPEPDLPPGVSADEHLAALAWEGVRRRYAELTDEVRNRLEYELDVVRQTGFSAYILIVNDFAQTARGRGIPFGVRGSAAASIILYCLGITDIDPLASRLVFERFLNVERREMPDVDMDFADDRREEMIRYTAEKYGYDRVAQIITFGTLGAKAALRDVGRALGMSYGDVDRVVRLVPNALHMTIERALAESNELRNVFEREQPVRELIETARKVEGIARHSSTHAAGVVISRDPLIQHLPLQRPTRGEEDSIPMTQFDMNTVAEIGLLKMDFLGLSNLTILGRAVDLIRQTRSSEAEPLDLQTLPDGDPATYAMLSRGETFGVFQLESVGMRRALLELKPGSIAELAALVALYRPGPMQHISTYCRAKHGLEEIHYPHPDLHEILDETYGVIVYQDQVLLIARKFAGYSLGEADIMRKAMGKKIAEKMRGERDNFVKGAVAQGYAAGDATAIFDLIEPFAGYAFNKAHATCYAIISYQTAYLKANFPVEYMTAVLMLAENHPAGLAERVGQAVTESVKLGITVLCPDVNRSGSNFAREDGQKAIRFGLATIKNVGTGVAEAILAARAEGSEFASVEDFCRRVESKQLNRRVLESLVKAGAFDSLDDRGTLLANIERILSLAQREQKLRDSNQTSMFDLFGQSMPVPMPSLELTPLDQPIPVSEQLAWEKELLGVYVSEHPFRAAAANLSTRVSAMVSEVNAEMNGRELTLAGMVTTTRPLLTRDGRAFCAVEIEDLSGTLEVTVWPDVYESTKDLWQQGTIVLMTVKVRARDERLNAAVQRATRYSADGDGADIEEFEPPASDTAVAPSPRPSRALPPRTPGRDHAEPPPRPATHLPLQIHIDLRETDDEAADRRRLNELVQLLRGSPGSDRARLTLHARTEDVELELPSVNFGEKLELQVKRLVHDCGSLEVLAGADARSSLGAA